MIFLKYFNYFPQRCLGLNQYQVITAKVQGYLVSVKPKPITIMFEAIVSGNKFYYRLDFIQRKH